MAGSKRRDAAVRFGGGLFYYLAFILVAPILFGVSILWFLVDVLYQLVTGKEGLSDDGMVPRAYRKTQGTGTWALFGDSDSPRWGRK
ncbi:MULTISPECIES: hypothetical protein [Halorussus]|uniref:hypothetical protein n=1 Tax=Halorussus TaxID=1070314 RepID=UPI0020A13B4D|nr:hypothetical protein [Halorussus vallis]USZ78632.1 hypothetical protein NGM07_25115 [Halorussus vallis]USZ78663.1 hypothetical protein NGM07_24445 [Halorussus vallis]